MKYVKEDNIDFSEYSTTIKSIVIYNSNFNVKIENINKSNKIIDKNNIIIKQFEEHIDLARSHGIYGFAFYYNCSTNKNISYEPYNIILQNNYLKINFLLMFGNYEANVDEVDKNISQIFNDIKKYIVDERYIKIYNKSVIAINNDYLNKTNINLLRFKFNEGNLGEIFILSKANYYNWNIENNNLYNGIYYSPSYDELPKINIDYSKTNGYFYTHLIYHNLLIYPLNSNNIFRVSIPLTKYPLFINKTKTYVFWDYSPEKFYFLNKVIIDWTKENYNNDSQYIFIDNFNNLLNEGDLGYANINSFSKALFGLPVIFDINKNFNLFKLEKDVFVLIQVHIYYIDLISEIINKTNNIPVPFDLYITTNTKAKKTYIEKYLINNSKANNYEILITPNKGRDVIPCLIQLKNILLKYKYFCHIHTKKSDEKEELGKFWRHYLYENLLGNKSIIKQILSDFENYKELGFIFPDNFYMEIRWVYFYNHLNYYHLDKIFDILFPKMKIRAGNIMNFPAGNMFWAKTKAVYQIFNDKIIKLASEEKGQIDGTISHAIERFWLFLVKLNGFYYKTILYYI